MAARQRNRDAVGNLRSIASDLGIASSTRSQDVSLSDFQALHATVMQQAGTPEQRRDKNELRASHPVSCGHDACNKYVVKMGCGHLAHVVAGMMPATNVW